MLKYLLILWMLCISGVVHAQGIPVGKVYKKETVVEPKKDVGGLPVKTIFKKQKQMLNYREAYSLAQNSDKPFMIIIGATWCAPCVELKDTVIPKMFEEGKLDNVIVTHIDLDEEEELATSLMSQTSIPEIIVFRKRLGVWQRKNLIGKQTKESIESLIGEK